MKVKIPEQLWKLSKGAFAKYGLSDRELGWQKYVDLDLSTLHPKRVERLLKEVEPHTKIRGVGMMVRDIKTWLKVSAGDHSAKPRSVEQFCALLTQLLTDVPGHRVYERDERSETWLASYVESVKFVPLTRKHNGEERPPHVIVNLFWLEFGIRQSRAVVFFAEHCLGGLTPEAALQRKGLYPETPELRTQYLADVQKFDGIVGNIGLQLLAVGVGSDDLDGNKKPGDDSWRYGTNKFRLDHHGEPTRMVVDVYHEEDKENKEDDDYMDLWFWGRRKAVHTVGDDDAEEQGEPVDDDDDDVGRGVTRRAGLKAEDVMERPEPEVPIHPMLACFDFRRHLRLRVHVGCVTVYEYDTKLSEKLVLPADTRSVIEMLVTTNGIFKDIVKGKSGGAIVLCAGPPGVGKTLTAEVYSETMQRPLYSVQCSQLGTDPEELEGQLMRAFLRAQRWNAILLLDEADVYIANRGSDLAQNAIVGVFLRVMEYYAGVLFLTTNRSDLVDDAIASRCVARLDYAVPPAEDRRRIWKVLSSGAGIPLGDDVIDEAVRCLPNVSGRDIKNLLKLAQMLSESRGKPIDMEMLRFAKRFKPTVDVPAAGPGH
jgi:hypothetical protein